jgi:cytoskeletal protein CcmA (bactofilin family)
MWGDKKPEAPAKTPLPQQVKPSVTAPSISTSGTTSATPFLGEAKTMAPLDSAFPANTSTGGTARLGASLHIKGEITGNEDLVIDGSVEGLVQLEDRKLTVGASARVTADIISREVVVYGNVKGNLRARDRIEIKKDGSVVGDLTTARIMIEDGAYFKGSIEIDKAGDVNGEDKPSYTRAARSTAATSSSSSD